MRNLFAFTVLLALGCGQSSTTPISTETAVVTPAFNTGNLPTVQFSVPDMHCQACAGKVQETLAATPGVKDVKTDLSSKVVTVAVEKEAFDEAKATEALAAADFPGEVKAE
jgi:copper chaperone CopZ